MNEQQIILDYSEGKRLAQYGLSVAVNNANKEHPDWSKRCWDLFKRWIGKKEPGFQFLMEKFRQDCYKFNMIERPKSERAFGYITKRALKEGLVITSGTGKVANPKAHNANASILVKV